MNTYFDSYSLSVGHSYNSMKTPRILDLKFGSTSAVYIDPNTRITNGQTAKEFKQEKELKGQR